MKQGSRESINLDNPCCPKWEWHVTLLQVLCEILCGTDPLLHIIITKLISGRLLGSVLAPQLKPKRQGYSITPTFLTKQNRAKLLTAKDISGRVLTDRYIKLPTAD